MLAKLLIVPIVIAIGFVGWTVISNKQPSYNQAVYSSPTPQATSKIFTASQAMSGFSVVIPSGFEVEEKFSNVIIKKNNNEILISYRGAQEPSLQEVLSKEDLENRRVDYRNINNLEAGTATSDSRKVYYIYNNYALYSISTNNPQLYSILDQIAQSFTLPK